jgi:hypothetical protein
MNERIRELAISKGIFDSLCDPFDELKNGDCYSSVIIDLERFAKLIVQECDKISKETCNELKADESIQTPGSKINWNLYNATLRNKLAEHFGVEE